MATALNARITILLTKNLTRATNQIVEKERRLEKMESVHNVLTSLHYQKMVFHVLIQFAMIEKELIERACAYHVMIMKGHKILEELANLKFVIVDRSFKKMEHV